MVATARTGNGVVSQIAGNHAVSAGLISAIIAYPLLLAWFHRVGQEAVRATGAGALIAWAGVAALLLLAFAVPVSGFIIALGAGRRTPFTNDDLYLRNLAHFAVAVPPLYSATGAYFILFGISGYDPYAWAAVWALVLAVLLLKPDDATPVNMQQRIPPRWLRIAHGSTAAVAILAYVGIHLLHNAGGVLGAEFYNQTQATLRLWYQSSLVEPVIISAFLFLMGSGFVLAKYRTASFRDLWGTLLTTTGAYLGAFLLAHMTAALITARWKFGIETDWAWAAGDPPGLLADPWSVRLIPYYALAPVAVITHAACGLRIVLAGNGTDINRSERIARSVIAVGVILALVTIMALLGLQLTG